MNEVITQLLQRYVELVDAITPRGALRGDEILSVGMLRQRTIELLQEVANAQAEADAEAAAPPEAKAKK